MNSPKAVKLGTLIARKMSEKPAAFSASSLYAGRRQACRWVGGQPGGQVIMLAGRGRMLLAVGIPSLHSATPPYCNLQLHPTPPDHTHKQPNHPPT